MKLVHALCAIALLSACGPAEAPDAAAPEASVAAASELAEVATPAANARITSPLHVTGVAPANWYFENQFPTRLLDAQGQIIAEAPAHPRVNWTENQEPKEFDAELTFNVTTETPATLVLQEDMPGDNATPREVRVPVTLAPN